MFWWNKPRTEKDSIMEIIEIRVTVKSKHSEPSERWGYYFRGQTLLECIGKLLDKMQNPVHRGIFASLSGLNMTDIDVQYWGNHPKRGQLID